MEEIYKNVYVGDDLDYEKVKNKDNWSFARTCKYGDGGHQQSLNYHTQAAPKGKDYLFFRKNKNLLSVNILDLNDPNMIPFACIKAALDFVKERLESGDKVLIACNGGHSRGPSTGLAFLRSIGDMPHAFALSERIYHTLYPKYSPGQGIRQVLRSNWSALENMEIQK